MEFKPIILLILYFIGVFIFSIIALLNIYHIVRFSFSKKLGRIFTLVFLAVSLGVVIATLVVLKDVSWTVPLKVKVSFI